MPRKPRQESCTEIYHITDRGINKESVFQEKRERTRLLNLIRENQEAFNVGIYAYCIMPNHFHLLVKSEIEELSSFMAKILAEYAQYYNKKHNRKGYVFQNRFRSQCIESEAYYKNCLRYIHRNPLKANLCKNIVEYKHSSAREYFFYEKNGKDILCPAAFLLKAEYFGSDEGFFEFHQDMGGKYFFIDTKEDELNQQIEVAQKVLRDMEQELSIPAIEILDYTKTRYIFESAIGSWLHISGEKAKGIRKTIRSRM